MGYRNFRNLAGRVAMILAAGVWTSAAGSAQSLPTERNRTASAFHFAASERLVAFPVPAGTGTVALAVIDRQTEKKRLIYEDKSFLLYPRFSSDGKRLIIVRNEAYANERKLIVCTVDNWRCRVWLQTTATVRSPVELDESTILFASSLVDTTPDGKPRHNKHDFYLLRRGSQPQRLSNFGLHDISSINIAGSRLIFAAVEAPTSAPTLQQSRSVGPGSEIYALNFDQPRREIEVPTQPLRPLVLIDGYSGQPATGPDGKIAFTNRRGRAATRSTHFNLAIASPDGKIERYIEASGWAFSRPVFVGNTMLANETFDKHYEVKVFDLANAEASTLAKLEYDQRAIRALDRISLTFDQ